MFQINKNNLFVTDVSIKSEEIASIHDIGIKIVKFKETNKQILIYIYIYI